MVRKYSRTPSSSTDSGGVSPRGGNPTPDYTTGDSPTTTVDRDLTNLPMQSSQTDVINLLVKLLGGKNSDFASLLQHLGFTTGNMNAGEIQDQNKTIIDMLLKYAMTQEQRGYDKSVLDEQRLYDSPLNQLARLMGSGISRDAAIQMLGSGGSGAGSGSALIGSGENAALPASAIPATQSDLNALQGKLGIANTVFGGISAVSGLVGLGFSIPQAIQSVKALSMQNVMSQKALVGLQSADAVLSALEGAVETGVLSTKDMDGFSNATDALNYINDHKDTNAFSPLFQSGAFANVYGTKLGREMFANAWKNVRSSKDDGTILDQFIKQNDLKNELSKLDVKKTWQDLSIGLRELALKDEQIYQLWVNNEIDGVRLKIVKEDLKGAELRGYLNAIDLRAAKRVYGDRARGENGIGTGAESGVEMLAFNEWWSMCKEFQKSSMEHGVGKDNWLQFFKNNTDAAMFAAKMKLTQQKFREQMLDTDPTTGENPFVAAVLQFCSLLLTSGAWNAVDGVVKPVRAIGSFVSE